MINKNILIVFIKYPEPGKVKTRLAQSIGVSNACHIYKCFVPVVLNRIKSAQYSTRIFFDPPQKHEQIKNWLGAEWDLAAQTTGSLGDRLKNAFAHTFEQGAKKVVVIGSDSPLLNNRVIEQAFCDLDKYECVIGPSSDGGYYLLGIKTPTPELFDIEEWSTNVVFEKTMQKVMSLCLRASILEEHFDVDEREDLVMLIKKLEYPEQVKDIHLIELRKKLKKIGISP